MWHPPQRIKYAPLPTRWPTAQEAAASPVFQPIQVGPVRLEERTWVPAMVPWRATEEGSVTQDILDWYERFARGQPGAIVVEATGVRDIKSGPLLRIHDDRFVPGLARLAETVRRASGGRTRLFIQIIDFLRIHRRVSRETYFRKYFAISDRVRRAVGGSDEEIRERLIAMSDQQVCALLTEREWIALQYGYRERVWDMDLPHIRDLPKVLPQAFAAAARRARAAGFDGVELHYAHAYTMAGFLSRRNTRDDGYGGSRENRVRLPLEVYRAVRAEVGSQFVVGVRFLTDEIIEGGSRVEDAEYFGVEFARAGFDYLSLSRGGKFEDARQPEVGWAAYPYTGPSGYECIPTYLSDERGPFGRNVPDTARVRAAVRRAGFATPVVVSGGIHSWEQMVEILNRGWADIIGAARQSLADPDWFRKIRLGRGGEIRRCTYTNYCEALDQKHKKVTCKLWDRIGVPRGERRLVAPDWAP